jgi:galactoside O-acetyltransferase
VSLYTHDELRAAGVGSVGAGARVDRSVRFFGAQHISIGDHARIDCFAVLSAGPGEIVVGEHAHLAVGVCVYGAAGVRIGQFASLSARVAVYSIDDDYTGGHLAVATVPEECRAVRREAVEVGDFVVVGSGSVVLPGVWLGRGAAVGALSLVKADVEAGAVVAGAPARVVGRRPAQRLDELAARARADDAGA